MTENNVDKMPWDRNCAESNASSSAKENGESRKIGRKNKGRVEETLVTSSQPCLPGSVVGECSMRSACTSRKITKVGGCVIILS